MMDNEMLKENIENLETIIGNLEDHIFEQNALVDKINIDITDTEENIHCLEEIEKQYKKLLEETKAKEIS
jgi:t-SNARE complex subunit (syntaxin)